MKLEPNMYVRTKEWGIQKIGWFDNEEPIMECGFTAFQKSGYKASHNIIDLIEVGDYVNGERVEEIWKKVVLVGQECRPISFNNIKSIVTSQQFESICYKLGDSNE